MIKREILKIHKGILSKICGWYHEKDEEEAKELPEFNNYEFIEKEITNSDPEDGGYDATIVFKRISDNKYFSFDYQEWDINWEYGHWENFNPEIEEVFPEIIQKTIYK